MGLVNVHGELQLCVSLQHLLQLQLNANHHSDNKQQRLLVMRLDDGRWVFPVDEVHGIQHLKIQQFRAVPASLKHFDKALVSQLFTWQDNTVARIDPQRLQIQLQRSVQ